MCRTWVLWRGLRRPTGGCSPAQTSPSPPSPSPASPSPCSYSGGCRVLCYWGIEILRQIMEEKHTPDNKDSEGFHIQTLWRQSGGFSNCTEYGRKKVQIGNYLSTLAAYIHESIKRTWINSARTKFTNFVSISPKSILYKMVKLFKVLFEEKIPFYFIVSSAASSRSSVTGCGSTGTSCYHW